MHFVIQSPNLAQISMCVTERFPDIEPLQFRSFWPPYWISKWPPNSFCTMAVEVIGFLYLIKNIKTSVVDFTYALKISTLLNHLQESYGPWKADLI